MLHYLLGCCIQTGTSKDVYRKNCLFYDVFPKLRKTPGGYHWVKGVIKVSLSTLENIQMALVRAKRQVLDSTPQERLNLDENAKDYLKSALTVQKALQLAFPVRVIKELWPNETGLLFTIIMLHTRLLHTDLLFSCVVV